ENDFGDYSSFKTNTIDLINKNNDTSYVFSGESSGISELISEAEIKGAYITKILPINIPYHSRLTHGLRRQWEEIVNDYVFSPASLPIIDTHKQSIVCSAKDCRNLAINSFCHAFSWYGSLKIMASLGITNLYECGPGLSLSKIGEFTDLGHTYVNIKSLKRSC
ncbi:MAG: hypothetical protein OEY89_18555, partial [Gammaproteobacteria bacterium]|nr:hypothetical protein [Gammaproteobacteria bacterium]